MSAASRFDTDYILRKANEACPPISGSCYQVSVSTTSAPVQIPDALLNRYVTFQNDGSNTIYIVFGNSGVVAAPAVASGATACLAIPAGSERRWHLARADGYTHFAVIASTGTPALRYGASSRTP